MNRLTAIEQSDKEFLTVDEVAAVLESAPATIRKQAHDDPAKLGFPAIVIGTRVRIPRIPFIKFLKGELLYGRTFNH